MPRATWRRSRCLERSCFSPSSSGPRCSCSDAAWSGRPSTACAATAAAASRRRGRRRVGCQRGRRRPRSQPVRRLPRRRCLRAGRARGRAGAVARPGPRQDEGPACRLRQGGRRHRPDDPRRLRLRARAAPRRVEAGGVRHRLDRRTQRDGRRRAPSAHAPGGGASARAPGTAPGQRGAGEEQAGVRRGRGADCLAPALTGDAGRRCPRLARGPRPGVLPSAEDRAGRPGVRLLQVPLDDRRRARARGEAASSSPAMPVRCGSSSATRGSPGSGSSSAATPSTSCHSCSTSCAAR